MYMNKEKQKGVKIMQKTIYALLILINMISCTKESNSTETSKDLVANTEGNQLESKGWQEISAFKKPHRQIIMLRSEEEVTNDFIQKLRSKSFSLSDEDDSSSSDVIAPIIMGAAVAGAIGILGIALGSKKTKTNLGNLKKIEMPNLKSPYTFTRIDSNPFKNYKTVKTKLDTLKKTGEVEISAKNKESMLWELKNERFFYNFKESGSKVKLSLKKSEFQTLLKEEINLEKISKETLALSNSDTITTKDFVLSIKEKLDTTNSFSLELEKSDALALGSKLNTFRPLFLFQTKILEIDGKNHLVFWNTKLQGKLSSFNSIKIIQGGKLEVDDLKEIETNLAYKDCAIILSKNDTKSLETLAKKKKESAATIEITEIPGPEGKKVFILQERGFHYSFKKIDDLQEIRKNNELEYEKLAEKKKKHVFYLYKEIMGNKNRQIEALKKIETGLTKKIDGKYKNNPTIKEYLTKVKTLKEALIKQNELTLTETTPVAEFSNFSQKHIRKLQEHYLSKELLLYYSRYNLFYEQKFLQIDTELRTELDLNGAGGQEAIKTIQSGMQVKQYLTELKNDFPQNAWIDEALKISENFTSRANESLK